MHRQVGTLRTKDGIAYRGMIIRHLVLPENLAATDRFVKWVVSELGPETHVNIMGQYRPMFQSNEHPPLDRPITREEFEQAMQWARDGGLRNFH
jgi:putative pyruvate formate lyase activating enzyme